MPRVRFRLRWLMAAVAVLAVLLWGWRMRQLSRTYAELAAAARSDRDFWERGVKMSEAKVTRWTSKIADHKSKARRALAEGAEFEQVARNYEALADISSRMLTYAIEEATVRRKHRDESEKRWRVYARAARYPWLHVEHKLPELK